MLRPVVPDPSARLHSQPLPRIHSQPLPRIHSQPLPRIHSQPLPRIHSQPLPRIHSRTQLELVQPQRGLSEPLPRAHSQVLLRIIPPLSRPQSQPLPRAHSQALARTWTWPSRPYEAVVAQIELQRSSYARRIAKRALDVFGSLVGLLVLLPVMLALALGIKLTSRGPILFVQERSGLGGRRFRFLKFRTMAKDAEQRKHALAHLNEMSGPVFKIRHDPRITSLGRVLRKLSLDELPQLWNVLRG